MTRQAEIAGQLRQILADLTGDAAMLGVSAQTPLLHDGVGLDSLGGTILLNQVHSRFGVDVAGEDLNFDSLATLGTLTEFVAARVGEPAADVDGG